MTEQWSRAATADGQQFVFADEGDGPLVILLHGYPDTPHGWERSAAALAEAGFRAVRPWLRGYHPDTLVEGRGYDALTIAGDPVALLDALGEEQAILVGHDWGAALTYGAATIAPDRVRAIVPIAIPHPTQLPRDPATLWGARHFLALKMPWAEAAVRRGDFHYVETLYSRWAPNWSGPEREQCIANAKACFAEPSSLSGSLDYYRSLAPKPPAEFLTPPAVRGLVVGGTVDIVKPEIFEQTPELLGPGSESLIVGGAGHWPHREGEDEFIAALLSFLGRL
ncbi:MAG: alpha/beta fold hydrolase [Solirubrobacterales bacterium]